MKKWICLFMLVVCRTGAEEERFSKFTTPWRNYEVYAPQIETHTVYEYDGTETNWMNHCANAAWFKDRWIALWNFNEKVVKDGKPWQHTLMSTSFDGVEWTQPVKAFCSSEGSENPLPYTEGLEWQPGMIVAGDKLIAVWSKLEKDEWYQASDGCYISVMTDPAGKWTNHRLTFDGETAVLGKRIDEEWSQRPKIHGMRWRVFPCLTPTRLSSGRILAPVVLMKYGPTGMLPKTGKTTIDTALYSDDNGQTWKVSPGTMMPSGPDSQWEPIFFEQPNGDVMMFSKNQAYPPENSIFRTSERLAYALSRDGGETWTPKRTIPLDVSNARMMVNKGAGDRYYMISNDWLLGNGYGNRFNLALFFNRGGGINFVPGIGISQRDERHAHYPASLIKDDALYVIYTVGEEQKHSLKRIRMSKIFPLPGPDKYFIFPRSNLNPAFHHSIVAENGLLQITGEASAGLDVDANDRAAGDGVLLRFSAKVLSGDKLVLCTIGGEKDYVELRVDNGKCILKARNFEGYDEAVLGEVSKDWKTFELFTGGNQTGCRIAGEKTYQFVKHNPAGTWVYLGKGYRRSPKEETIRPYDFDVPETSSFAVKIDSVQTCVQQPLFDMQSF